MKNSEIKIGDKVKAGFRKPAGLPREYVEGVVVSLSLTKVAIEYFDEKNEVIGVALKKHCTLIEAA